MYDKLSPAPCPCSLAAAGPLAEGFVALCVPHCYRAQTPHASASVSVTKCSEAEAEGGIGHSLSLL